MQKGQWQGRLRPALAELPPDFASRVEFVREDRNVIIRVDAHEVGRLIEWGNNLELEPTVWQFAFGRRKGHQIADVQREVLALVLPALGLRRGWCGNLGTLDGKRIDGQGVLQQTPLEDAMEAIEALQAATDAAG